MSGDRKPDQRPQFLVRCAPKETYTGALGVPELQREIKAALEARGLKEVAVRIIRKDRHL